MTAQTRAVLLEMMKQAIDEDGYSPFLWMVSEAIENMAKEFPTYQVSKAIFYHRHASDFFSNRAETLKDSNGKSNS